ncbi:hypothetical protein [uncultured Clostridium sp.]|uniref:hypothetical protein n=1 Tax=uncultured Clostridium sp. TaxID=59620 RepID=UPI0025EC6624|nr:hypothetical protein [uncultured Clostridium sp.]
MRVKKVFDYYCDPSHGWVKVPYKILMDLGIEKEITSYSYMLGDNCYLEENCDASLFQRAYEEKYNIKIDLNINYGNKRSKIRGYKHYEAR